MSDGQNIFVTGYYGTGSSAVIDLMSEYDGTACAIGRRYEHSLFLCRGGLIDLYERCFGDMTNRMIRDRAINDFIDEMYRQNDNDFGWYGSYKKLYGKKFSENVNEFVSAISCDGDKKAIAHGKGVRFSFVKAILQLGAAVLKGYKITKLGRQYCYDGKTVRYLTADEQEFLLRAKKFTSEYFSMCKTAETMIYDHIILPEQSGSMSKFFPDCKLIIVDRDPRDVYLSSNYVWNTVRCGKQIAPFPPGAEAFCSAWKEAHERAEKYAEGNKNVLFVQFEDLIYDYENATKKIAEFCGLEEKNHVRKGEILQTEKSIKNTQVFLKSEKFAPECEILEKNLGKYFYNFPYKTATDIGEIEDL